MQHTAIALIIMLTLVASSATPPVTATSQPKEPTYPAKVTEMLALDANTLLVCAGATNRVQISSAQIQTVMEPSTNSACGPSATSFEYSFSEAKKTRLISLAARGKDGDDIYHDLCVGFNSKKPYC